MSTSRWRSFTRNGWLWGRLRRGSAINNLLHRRRDDDLLEVPRTTLFVLGSCASTGERSPWRCRRSVPGVQEGRRRRWPSVAQRRSRTSPVDMGSVRVPSRSSKDQATRRPTIPYKCRCCFATRPEYVRADCDPVISHRTKVHSKHTYSHIALAPDICLRQ